jgi:hypothetical protein
LAVLAVLLVELWLPQALELSLVVSLEPSRARLLVVLLGADLEHGPAM